MALRARCVACWARSKARSAAGVCAAGVCALSSLLVLERCNAVLGCSAALWPCQLRVGAVCADGSAAMTHRRAQERLGGQLTRQVLQQSPLIVVFDGVGSPALHRSVLLPIGYTGATLAPHYT